jgi:hypothetical protein
MMFAELKTAEQVREHARIVQRRIDQRRAVAALSPLPPREARPAGAVDEVPEEPDKEYLPLAPLVVVGHPTRTVIAIAADYFGLQLGDLIGASRNQKFILPRQIGCFVAKRLGASLPKIGRAVQRDHSTVHYGCRTIESRVRKDEILASAVNAIGSKAAAAFGARWRAVNQ